MELQLALIGLLVGLLVGVSGVGGSSLMAPLLILVVRLNPLVAVGTDLLYSVPTKLLGAIVHLRQGTVDSRTVLRLSLGGIPGAALGIVILRMLDSLIGHVALASGVRFAVALMLFLVALLMLLTPLLSRLHKRDQDPGTSSRGERLGSPAPVIVLGAVVGLCVSLTSVGSGSLTLPVLYLLAPWLGLRRLVGSNIAFAAVLIPIATIGHLGLGQVDLQVAANLLVGSLPGVLLGSRLCATIPDQWLRPAVAGILVWAGAALA